MRGDEVAVDEEADLGSRPIRSGTGAADPTSCPGAALSVCAAAVVRPRVERAVVLGAEDRPAASRRGRPRSRRAGSSRRRRSPRTRASARSRRPRRFRRGRRRRGALPPETVPPVPRRSSGVGPLHRRSPAARDRGARELLAHGRPQGRPRRRGLGDVRVGAGGSAPKSAVGRVGEVNGDGGEGPGVVGSQRVARGVRRLVPRHRHLVDGVRGEDPRRDRGSQCSRRRTRRRDVAAGALLAQADR